LSAFLDQRAQRFLGVVVVEADVEILRAPGLGSTLLAVLPTSTEVNSRLEA
jgi:hypothetical protein